MSLKIDDDEESSALIIHRFVFDTKCPQVINQNEEFFD